MSDLEAMVPPDIVAEMEAVYSEPYDFSDARIAGESTKMVKGKAAAVMAASGADFDEICAVLGFNSARHAELAVQRALADSLDSWDKADLKRLFMNRFEILFRGALRRSQTKGYYAREAAATTALKALIEQTKFAGSPPPPSTSCTHQSTPRSGRSSSISSPRRPTFSRRRLTCSTPKWSTTVTKDDPPRPVLRHVVNRLDPDGHLRDLIDEALRRYHQRRDVDEGTPPLSHERHSDG